MKNRNQNDASQVPSGEIVSLPIPHSSWVDPVDLAGEESFPASDPPAWTMGAENRGKVAPSPPAVPSGARPVGYGQVIDFAEARARRGKTTVKLQDPIARIYRPAPSAMQSGRARSRRWVLEFLSSTPPFVEPLMGWTGSADPRQHVSLCFDSREQAVTYAQRQRLPFFVAERHERRPRLRTYADTLEWEFGGAAPP